MLKQALFLVSLLIFAVCNILFYFYLNDHDRRYSSLITEGTNQLKIIQRVSFLSNRGYILLLKTIETDDPAEIHRLDAERIAIGTANSKFLDSLLASHGVSEQEASELVHARQVYRDRCAEFIALSHDGKATTRDFERLIDGPFQEYQNQINKIFSTTNKSIQDRSADFTTEVRRKGAMILALGFSPVILVTAVSVIAIGLFGILFVLSEKEGMKPLKS